MTPEQVLTAIELLLNMGFTVSIDLLYGLPGQHVSGLLHDLKIAAGAGVHHISAYPLMLFPYTRLMRISERGLAPIQKSGACSTSTPFLSGNTSEAVSYTHLTLPTN